MTRDHGAASRFVRIGPSIINPAAVSRIEPLNSNDSRVYFDHSSMIVKDMSPSEVAWHLSADDQLAHERLRHPAGRVRPDPLSLVDGDTR